ncbi:MAG TPA: phosphodiester glycosidase family protein [Niabella sp.]|nr:phosphodiester glycosidase family protein [Niabella sp.]
MMNRIFYLLVFLFIFSSCKKDTPSTPPSQEAIKIESVSPGTAQFGDTIIIKGSRFPANPTVKFRETTAWVISSSATEIKVIMPDIEAGTLRILVSSGNQASNYFNITAASSVKEILVRGTKYLVDTVSNYDAGPGIRFIALNLTNASAPLKVFLLEMNRNNQYLDFKPVLGGDSTTRRETIVSMSQRKSKPGENYIAGINGDFFNTSTGRPLQGTIIDEIAGIMPTNPAENYLVIDNAKKMYAGKLTYSGSVTTATSSTISIADVNNTRNTGQLILYNKYNGKSTKTNTSGSEVVVVPVSGSTWGLNKNISLRVSQAHFDAGNSTIPEEGAVLSGSGTAATFLKTLSVGDVVTVKLNLISQETPGLAIKQVIGAHDYMLRNGSFINSDWNERHPRTGVGFSADGDKIYYIVVDGRLTASVGVTTYQLADILRLSGAAYAVNLDGGGSSAMFVKEVGIVNTPSDGSPRAVGNALFTISSAPEDNQITRIAADKYNLRVSKGQSITIKALGYNQYGALVNANLGSVSLSCAPELGTISGNTFTASNTNAIAGNITVSYNNIKEYVKVRIY